MAHKVLLIGWDAADWKIITPLMDAGLMPNLERLVSQGVMGNLSTLRPILSPMLWTSIATGKRAYKHGIHGFSEPDSQSGGVRPISNLGRKTKALWNILQQNGLKSNVVGWWPSHPAEPISGVMVSNHYQQAPSKNPEKPWPMRPGTVHPARLAQAMREFRIHPGELDGDMLRHFVPQAPEIDQTKDQRLYSVAKILAENASIHAAATASMQLEPWDFMGVYFDGIDHFCHGFIKYHPPRLEWIPEADFDLYKNVVNAGYQFHDLMLGTYMQLAGEEATIIIVSDHGFHPDHLRPRELPNEPAGPADEHREFGVFAMKGPGIKQDDLVFGASLLDITPTILTLFGLPLGRDMDGKPLLSAFQSAPALQYVESWDNIPGDAGLHPAGMQVDPVDQAAALKQLVELGYIDKPDENLQKAAESTIKELRYNLAQDYLDARHIPEASAIFTELWDAHPDESRFGIQLVNCQLSLGQAQQAQHTLSRLVTQKQRYAQQAAEQLSQLQEQWKERKLETLSIDEQRQVMQLRKRAGVNLATFAFLSGRVLAAAGQHEAALAEFAQAAEVQTHNRPSLYLQMADSLMALGRVGEAQQHYLDTLAIDPINAEARLGLGRVYLHHKQAQQALDEIMASIGLVFHNPRAHCLCAEALIRLERTKDAQAALHTALAQNPVFPQAQRLLAFLYMRQKQTDLAVHHRALARAAQARIRAFQAGNPLPQDVDLPLDVALVQSATVASLSTLETLAPLEAGTVVVVSGLPRSGTSMMMQMLVAGGLTALSDDERVADDNNPRGYLELEAVKRLGRDTDTRWLDEASGKAVKIVAPLLPNLPQGRCYRIIFMERPLKEVVASQAAMLKNLGKEASRLGERQLAAVYLKQLEQVRHVLQSQTDHVKVLAMDYNAVVCNPGGAAAKVNRFLGGMLNEAHMGAAVAPELRHQQI